MMHPRVPRSVPSTTALVFSVTPSAVNVKWPFWTMSGGLGAVQVRATTNGFTTNTAENGPCTLSSASGSAIGGVVTVSFVNGIATFERAYVTSVNAANQITASAAGYASVTSGSFASASATTGVYFPVSHTYAIIGGGGTTATQNCLVFIPIDYDDSAPARPTMTWHSGSGSRSASDTSLLLLDGIGSYLTSVAATYTYGISILVQFPNGSPQGGREWGYPATFSAEAAVFAKLNCDPAKRAVAGYSLGAQLISELQFSYAGRWSAVLVCEGDISPRISILGATPAPTTFADAAAMVAPFCSTQRWRQFQSVNDPNIVPANAETVRDAFNAIPCANFTYAETGWPGAGLGHTPAYNAAISDVTNHAWMVA
jgi:hypothetical protein